MERGATKIKLLKKTVVEISVKVMAGLTGVGTELISDYQRDESRSLTLNIVLKASINGSNEIASFP